MDVKNTHSVTKTEISVFGRQALDAERRRSPSLADKVLTMAEFDKTCKSHTAQLWLMYMDMVMILKRCIHAERVGLWEEHLAELENMLLYLVAAGRCKCVSCLPHYLEAMIGLPTLALDILKAFKMDRSLYVKQKLSPMVSGKT